MSDVIELVGMVLVIGALAALAALLWLPAGAVVALAGGVGLVVLGNVGGGGR